jgi:hypothetical protein
MVAVMFLGMAVLGAPLDAALNAAGVKFSNAPAVSLLTMATTMTIPMVALMRYRGHNWQPSMEMAASMFIPTFAVIGLLGAGVVTGMGPLMVLEHSAMLPAMLVAMLLRRDEYTGGAHGHARVEVAA